LNAPAASGNFLVSCTAYAFFEFIDSRTGEDWMRVRIDEAGQ
jgi:hypothetical protein